VDILQYFSVLFVHICHVSFLAFQGRFYRKHLKKYMQILPDLEKNGNYSAITELKRKVADHFAISPTLLWARSSGQATWTSQMLSRASWTVT